MKKLKVLILALSSYESIYPDLRKAQQDTWDSIYIPEIFTLYYHSSEIIHHTECFEELLRVPCSPAFEWMAWRLKLALDFCLKNFEFNHILRISASTYVDKEKALEFSDTLPLNKCYAGGSGLAYDAGSGKDVPFCMGSGFWLSRDCAQILADNIQYGPDVADDVVVGRIMENFKIPITPFVIKWWYHHKPETRLHQYRCKGLDPVNDGKADIKAMEEIFNSSFYNPCKA